MTDVTIPAETVERIEALLGNVAFLQISGNSVLGHALALLHDVLASKSTPPPPSLRDEVAAEIGQVCGAVSMCWDPRPTGLFESTIAGDLTDEATDAVLAVVRRHVEAMDVWADDDVRGDQWNHARDAVLQLLGGSDA